jgi:hypothetical protein
MSVKILNTWTEIGGKDTDVLVEFEYHVPPGDGFQGGDVWIGTVHFSEKPEPFEIKIVERFGAKYGPLLPELLTAGRLHEAVCGDEVHYIYQFSPKARRVFDPVLAAAREHYARTAAFGRR